MGKAKRLAGLRKGTVANGENHTNLPRLFYFVLMLVTAHFAYCCLFYSLMPPAFVVRKVSSLNTLVVFHATPSSSSIVLDMCVGFIYSGTRLPRNWCTVCLACVFFRGRARERSHRRSLKTDTTVLRIDLIFPSNGTVYLFYGTPCTFTPQLPPGGKSVFLLVLFFPFLSDNRKQYCLDDNEMIGSHQIKTQCGKRVFQIPKKRGWLRV